ncbi:nitrogenase stabilizing/protective protein NifW (plasmid) [Bradyrhizobium sp. CCBAU 53351]|uniref:Nitrogenase-stabilizing/protective protein NifW n=2 Tax=Bradyrhizobium TaxID=374 RepID=A0AAE6CCK0_9BRAD|nr:nitrogenase stabilizing/protective protein NifW [Bradyrhizobium guangdongense]QAU50814.1 nitrogenase stabilizing/protective protein NifW [Bradyrhizobium guangzhouense]QOZ49595.1 nitrogenase stabilizing/protective protein NifW [Bradyrhizobium sp. CCBAU 53340]QOZ56712.1 nitrogenase stabilizing/protective protein NifW [Bradyrhizobium sp. CCBAU 53338]QOZ81354.1 nitrogenase stabilizing/protective protein NifW [Bradyrhizobium sp. CCBAU 53351]
MSDGIIARLSKAASAEEFFALLGVDYDPKVVNVARLHILRRMGEYLAKESLSDLADDSVAKRCKLVLERAYSDFVTSPPIEQRVFKVLKDAAPDTKPVPVLVQIGNEIELPSVGLATPSRSGVLPSGRLAVTPETSAD